MEDSTVVPVERLTEEPYISVLCYPSSSKIEAENRLKELKRLGITVLEFAGKKQVCGLPVLGKGCVGIVTLARRGEEKVALKIRRLDADRPSMGHEAGLLEKANSVGVGPKLLGVGGNFLVMQFVDGDLLPHRLETNPGKAHLKKILGEILNQCWRLDRIRLDHGELAQAPKHFIVDSQDRPFMVDFESASLDRRPSNVTAVCHFLFMSSNTAKMVSEELGEANRETLVEALRQYKKDFSRANFSRVMIACGL